MDSQQNIFLKKIFCWLSTAKEPLYTYPAFFLYLKYTVQTTAKAASARMRRIAPAMPAPIATECTSESSFSSLLEGLTTYTCSACTVTVGSFASHSCMLSNRLLLLLSLVPIILPSNVTISPLLLSHVNMV